MLRQFLYLDRPLVREFLAQLEGGIYDESREKTTNEGKRGLNAKVGAGPAAAGVEGSKSRLAESEAVIKQTSASEFDRLYGQLERGGLQIYDAIDEKLEFLPIRRKDIIEVDARIQVSGLQTLLDLTSTFSQLIPLIQVVGPSQDIDQQTIDTMQAMSRVGSCK